MPKRSTVDVVAGASTLQHAAFSQNGAVRARSKRVPKRARYSVIVPATNAPDTLERCLAAIGRATHPPDEVIVVDGPASAGPAAARNAGAARASGSILIFVDADVEVHPSAFARIHAAFERDPELVAVFGSYDAAASPHGTVSTFRNLLHHYVHHSAEGQATTFWAGLGAIRRKAFTDVQGFDDVRFHDPSVEDIELGLRLAAAGGGIRLDPAIQGTHLKRWSLRHMVATDVNRRGTPWTALVLEHGASATRLNLRGRHLAAAILFTTSIGSLLLRRPRLATPLAAGYLGLNTRFYRLVLRSAGPRSAAAGVGLLALHNAAALASMPLGAISFGRLWLHRQVPAPDRPVRSAQSQRVAQAKPHGRFSRAQRTEPEVPWPAPPRSVPRQVA